MADSETKITKVNDKDISRLVEEDINSLLEPFHGDMAFTNMIKGLINNKNYEQLWAQLTERVLEGYKRGLMQCYDLFKKHGREDVYEFIEQFDGEKFYKGYLKRLKSLSNS